MPLVSSLFSLQSFQSTTVWIYRYIREVYTAIIDANLPLKWTLLQPVFGLRGLNKSSSPQFDKTTKHSNFWSPYGNLTSRTRDAKDRKQKDLYATDITPSESQEQINEKSSMQLKIWQYEEVYVRSEQINHVDHSSLSDRSENSAPRNTNVVALSRSIDNDYIICDG